MSDPRLPELVGQRIKSGEAKGGLTFKRKDGTKFEGELSTVVFNDNKGNLRSSMIIRDISESKEAEKKLIESESRFRKIFELSSFGMVMVNKELKFTAINDAFCRMTGYTEEELLNFRFTEITHPDDISDNMMNVAKLIKREIPVYKTEKRFIRKDGEVIWVNLMVTANFSSEGEFLYNVATTEDITDRKLAEESFKKTAERLDLATSSAKMGIWDWDIKNNSLIYDDRMYELYGIKKGRFSRRV